MTDVSDTRLASRQTAFQEISIIDISALVDGSDPEGVARKVGEVCETVGFFYVENHGVSKDLIARMYAATQQFFRLPAETKQRLHVANSGPTLRGYIPPYGENADPNNSRDLKEVFDFAVSQEEVSPFFGPNTVTRGRFILLGLDALAPVAGVLLGTMIHLPPVAVGLYLGYFAGVLLYLATADILPQAHTEHESLATLGLTVAGAMAMWVVVGFSR